MTDVDEDSQPVLKLPPHLLDYDSGMNQPVECVLSKKLV